MSTTSQELWNNENDRMTTKSPETFQMCGEFSRKSFLDINIGTRDKAHVPTLPPDVRRVYSHVSYVLALLLKNVTRR